MGTLEYYAFSWMTVAAVLLLLHQAPFLHGQEVVQFANPSFEAVPQRGISSGSTPIIEAWRDCAADAEYETTPFDIQPGFWGVTLEPKHGSSYIGLVTRESGTYECIGQPLRQPLEPGKLYSISLYVATCGSHRRFINSKEEQENAPAIYGNSATSTILLRIRGVDTFTGMACDIYTSSPIVNEDWEQLRIIFSPSCDTDYMIFEAYFIDPTYPVHGNVLIDALNMDLGDRVNIDTATRERSGLAESIHDYAAYQLLDLILDRSECASDHSRLSSILNVYQFSQKSSDGLSEIATMPQQSLDSLKTDLLLVGADNYVITLSSLSPKESSVSDLVVAQSQQPL